MATDDYILKHLQCLGNGGMLCDKYFQDIEICGTRPSVVAYCVYSNPQEILTEL